MPRLIISLFCLFLLSNCSSNKSESNPPSIDLIAPTEGLFIEANQALKIKGIVEDDSEMEKISVSIYDQIDLGKMILDTLIN